MSMFMPKALITFFFIAVHLKVFAQLTEYSVANTQRIDSYLNSSVKENICEGVITYPQKYKSSKIKSDAFIVFFINNAINNGITSNEITARLKKLGKKKAAIIKESINGLIQTMEILLMGNYMRANIILGFIGDRVVRNKVKLVTTTHAKCGMYNNSMLDFKVIREYYIKDVKMLFDVGYDELTSDTIYSDNLTALSSQQKEYKFSIPGSSTESWINEIFTKQYHTDEATAYNYFQAPKDFVRLIKENKIAEVKDLLFSPSYTTSVNAMESLIYLASIGKVQVTTEMGNRIAQIKTSYFVIMQLGAPDVLYKREGYKELQMTDERVIKKYSSSM